MMNIALRDVSCATSRAWNRTFLLLATIFIGTAARACLHLPLGGHVHRQSDTMGMALRFAEEFRARGGVALDFLFYPRILQSGLLDGINACELPLLNMLGGLFLLITPSPETGYFLTGILILLVNIYVGYSELPKLLAAWGAQASRELALALWLAVPAIANQSFPIMPEGLALALTTMAAARLLTSRNSPRQLLLAITLGSLGICVKPTAVLALGLAAFAPLLRPQLRAAAPYIYGALALAFALPAWWYGVHAPHVLAFAQGPQIFAGANIQPLTNLGNLGWRGLLTLLFREPHLWHFPKATAYLFVLLALWRREFIPYALFLLALFGVAILGGTAALMHGYYQIGAAPFAILLVARAMGAGSTPYPRPLRTISLALIAWGLLFNVRTNIWITGRATAHGKVDRWAFARSVRPEIPPGYALITDDGAYPDKLLTAGRHGEAAGAKVFTACENPAYAGLPIAILSSQAPPLGQDLCGGRPREIRHVIAYGTKWYITLLR